MRSSQSKIVYTILGLLICFFPFIIDLFSKDKRFPTFTYWIASFFRPSNENITRRMIIEFISKYFLFCSIACLCMFLILSVVWFIKKIKSEDDYLYLKKWYASNWILFVFGSFFVQAVYWIFKVEPYLEGVTQSYTLMAVFLVLITLGTFFLLPLSLLFPHYYSNVPFFAK